MYIRSGTFRNFPFATEVWPHFFTSTRFLNVMHKQNLGCRVKILEDTTELYMAHNISRHVVFETRQYT